MSFTSSNVMVLPKKILLDSTLLAEGEKLIVVIERTQSHNVKFQTEIIFMGVDAERIQLQIKDMLPSKMDRSGIDCDAKTEGVQSEMSQESYFANLDHQKYLQSNNTVTFSGSSDQNNSLYVNEEDAGEIIFPRNVFHNESELVSTETEETMEESVLSEQTVQIHNQSQELCVKNRVSSETDVDICNPLSNYFIDQSGVDLDNWKESSTLHDTNKEDASYKTEECTVKSDSLKEENCEIGTFKCEKCNATFQNRAVLMNHCCTKLHQFQIKCKKCKLFFKSKQHLSQHLKLECGVTLHCTICKFQTKSKFVLKNHKKVNHNSIGEKVKCPLCGKLLKHAFSLFTHMASHKDSPRYEEEINRIKHMKSLKCPFCEEMRDNVYRLRYHILNTHSKRNQTTYGYKCSKCDKLLKTQGSLRAHVKNTHELKEKSCKCDVCGMAFYKNVDVKHHMINVHGNPDIKIKCEKCDYSTHSNKYFKEHMKLKHEPAKFMCVYCSHTFKTGALMRRHVMLIHEKDKIEQHTCTICNKKFNMKANLTKHIKTLHLQEKPQC